MPDPRAELRAMSRYGVPSPKPPPPPEPDDAEEEDDDAEEMDPILELARAIVALASREMPAPVINVQVHVPEQAPPVVTVTNEIPEQPAPVVRVTVPKQDPTPVTVEAPSVTLQVPAVQDMRIVSMPPLDATFEHDNRGRVTRVSDG